MHIKHMSLTHTCVHANIHAYTHTYSHMNSCRYIRLCVYLTLLSIRGKPSYPLYIYSEPANIFPFLHLKKIDVSLGFFVMVFIYFFVNPWRLRSLQGKPFTARYDPNNNHRTIYYIPTLSPIRYMMFRCKRKNVKQNASSRWKYSITLKRFYSRVCVYIPVNE